MDGPDIELARLRDDEDWLMRPVSEGFCKYESYFNGELDLNAVADLNDLIDVRQENERRYRAAQKED